jgi:NTP pyrophosphatase (non-canonical NTP hydrolase)
VTFEELQRAVHANADAHGWWDDPNVSEKIALLHSELSELLEVRRDGTAEDPCAKVPSISNQAEEMADVAIRLMDLAEFLGVDLATAIEKKHEFNLTRPYKHGKLF